MGGGGDAIHVTKRKIKNLFKEKKKKKKYNNRKNNNKNIIKLFKKKIYFNYNNYKII